MPNFSKAGIETSASCRYVAATLATIGDLFTWCDRAWLPNASGIGHRASGMLRIHGLEQPERPAELKDNLREQNTSQTAQTSDISGSTYVAYPIRLRFGSEMFGIARQ